MNGWLDVANSVGSSYKRNDLGWVLYALVRAYKPLVAVEMGVLEAYSTMFIAAALRENGRGHLWAYDLWEKYPYKHVLKEEAYANLEVAGLSGWVALHTADGRDVPDRIEGPIDFIHIDISNTGETYLWAALAFGDRLSPQGLMVLEGGSEERDQVEWMFKYQHMPIQPVLEQMTDWDWFVIEPSPSMTVMRRK